MMTVSVLKTGNSDSLRKKEFFSDYERELIEEHQWPESDQYQEKLNEIVQKELS